VSAWRSEITIDLGAVRANVRRLLAAVGDAEVWAVVKADGYGHGAVDVGRAALGAGASALCVATIPEALEVRAALPEARLLVMGPTRTAEWGAAAEARLEIAVADGRVPEGIPVHLKLDTGMGRWGLSELPSPTRETVGIMSHLATADTDPVFAELQVQRFREAVAPFQGRFTCHLANSAAALRLPTAAFDATRCGIAVYGLSPFGADPADDGLQPVLSWRSELALVKQLAPGESTGYGRRYLAERPTWIGIVPVGYADGFRRQLTDTHVLVDGRRRPVVGTVSMDAIAVELQSELSVGTPVTLVGDGLLLEEHARLAGTINYELASGINSSPLRARRIVIDARAG
jgi:alanine racemase